MRVFLRVGMKLFREKLRDWMMGMALFALIFQALILAAQAIPVGRNSNGSFDSLVICTAWGVKVLQLTTGEKPPVEQTSEDKCPVCSVNNLKLSLIGVDVPAPEPDFIDCGKMLPVLLYRAPELEIVSLAPIRAPPMFA